MEVDEKPKGEGVRQYYITKIEELQLIVAEKSQNLRRLQAQRNELNAKGICFVNFRRQFKFHKANKFVFICGNNCVMNTCPYYLIKVYSVTTF
jgi:hypothetical protein